MKQRHLAVCLLLATTCLTQAQETNPKLHQPYAPATIAPGAPKWMEKMNNLETVNYYEMVDSFEHYLMRTPEARHKKGITKPIVNHFRRWQKHYYPYVQKDGSIVLPSHEEFRQFVTEVNKEAKQKPMTRAAATNNGWKLLAPLKTYDYKKKHMTPAQSNVQRFAVSKSNPSILYCGTETGMVFKTTDAGQNWIACASKTYFGGEVSAVDVSTTNPNKVVVSAGPFVWLSTDGGNDWTDITPTQIQSKNYRTRDVVFNPTNDSEILMGNDDGLYKTTDSGSSWTRINQGMCFDVKYKIGTPSTIYALIRQNWKVVLAISKDSGASFETKLTDVRLSCGRIGLSEAENGRDYIYVLACQATESNSHMPPFYAGTPILFKSTDGGENWTSNNKLSENPNFQMLDRYGGQGYYDMVITASPKNPEHLLFGIIFLYSSKDGGNTIEMKGGYFGQHDLHCDMQDIYSFGNDTWLSTDGGVIYSNDFFDTHADTRINGIYASEFWGFDQGWNEDVMVGGRNHNGNMAYLDKYNGVSISMLGSETSTGYVFLSNPRKIAYSDSPENVFLPDNWLDQFEPFYGFWYYPYESVHHGLGFEYDPRYAKSFLSIRGTWEGEHKVLYKTVDDGLNYVQLPHQFAQPITGHAISRSNPDKVVVTTKAGGVFYSLDGGNSFQAYSDLPDQIQTASKAKVAIHPTNENEIWITTGEPGGMYRTTDNGVNWVQIDQNLTGEGENTQFIVNRFFLTGNEKNAVYAVGGVWKPLNNGGYMTFRARVLYWDNTTNGWQDYSEGLPPVITINRMLPFYKNGKIRIATNNGIWERDLKDKNFKPIAQPVILNAGKKEEGIGELLMDSYSIVNQEGAQWQWSFNPAPVSISHPTSRQTRVQVRDGVTYDVTLTVRTPDGKSDTKTVSKMITGGTGVADGIIGQEVLAHDIILSSNIVEQGQSIILSPKGISQACKWQLYNASGKAVQTENVAPTGNTSIDTNSLPKGLYIYTITSGTFNKTGKLAIK